MCIIAIAEKRKLTVEEFKTCWTNNPDGAGFAWYDKKGNLIVSKGFMKIKEALSFYETLPLPHVAHFRVGTSGNVCPELTHPFIVSKESEIVLSGKVERVLFHNGVVSDWKNYMVQIALVDGKMLTGKINDSRVIASLVSRIGEDILDHLGSKWVTMDKENMTYYGGDWEKEKGVLFSNTTYKSYRSTYNTYTANDKWWEKHYAPYEYVAPVVNEEKEESAFLNGYNPTPQGL
jgi:hypothetical protein